MSEREILNEVRDQHMKFAKTVALMRQAQKGYFENCKKNRETALKFLHESKRFEQAVDLQLGVLIPNPHTHEQPKLF